MTLRWSQTALVGFAAVLMALVAWNNIVDYPANWPFVRHVLAMDQVFPSAMPHDRAITAEPIVRTAYALIIGWEVISALLIAAGAIRMAVGSGGSRVAFRRAKALAVAGLALAMLLYGVGFLAVGGEWFLMWQSSTWNGTDAAARFFVVLGMVLIILLQEAPEAPADSE